MATTQKRYALITGASSGIGYELAKLFAKDGYHLVLVARDLEDLQNVASKLRTMNAIDTVVISKNLFEPNAPFELYEELKTKGITIDVLVNDAGQGVYGPFVESDIQRQLKIIQLNVNALTVLTYLFLNDMVARNEGRILQLASIVSELPAPLQAVYGGTKAYVLSFTEALISELKDTNVTLTALLPGPTDTDFFNKAGAQDSKLTAQLAHPAEVALDGYEALFKGKDKVISGFKNKVQSFMSNVLPDTVLADQIHKQSEKR
jgi:uncharacterized protein